MQNDASSQSMTPGQIQYALARLAYATLQPMHLATIGGVEIYQITAGWQLEVLKSEASTQAVRTIDELNELLESPHEQTLLIGKDRIFSQEDARTVMVECAFNKTVFWEI